MKAHVGCRSDLEPPFPSPIFSFVYNLSLCINITEETFLLLFSLLLYLISNPILAWPVIHIALIFQSQEALLHISASPSSPRRFLTHTAQRDSKEF